MQHRLNATIDNCDINKITRHLYITVGAYDMIIIDLATFYQLLLF